MNKINLEEFEHLLQHAKNVKELNFALEQFLLSYGINTYAFTYYNYYPNSLNKVKYDFSSKNLAVWHKHYINEGYEEIDTTLNVAYQSVLPIIWTTEQQIKNAKTARENKMRQDGLRYGSEKGMSIPVHGPQEDFAILLLIQRKGQHCLDHADLMQYDFLAVAYCYYHHLQRFMLEKQSNHPVAKLNSREIECLNLLLKQQSVAVIASTLNITVRTVNYHIQRLNKKLGTQNKYLSVIKALKKGIIKF